MDLDTDRFATCPTSVHEPMSSVLCATRRSNMSQDFERACMQRETLACTVSFDVGKSFYERCRSCSFHGSCYGGRDPVQGALLVLMMFRKKVLPKAGRRLHERKGWAPSMAGSGDVAIAWMVPLLSPSPPYKPCPSSIQWAHICHPH